MKIEYETEEEFDEAFDNIEEINREYEDLKQQIEEVELEVEGLYREYLEEKEHLEELEEQLENFRENNKYLLLD